MKHNFGIDIGGNRVKAAVQSECRSFDKVVRSPVMPNRSLPGFLDHEHRPSPVARYRQPEYAP